MRTCVERIYDRYYVYPLVCQNQERIDGQHFSSRLDAAGVCSNALILLLLVFLSSFLCIKFRVMSWICDVVLSVLSGLAVILLRKRFLFCSLFVISWVCLWLYNFIAIKMAKQLWNNQFCESECKTMLTLLNISFSLLDNVGWVWLVIVVSPDHMHLCLKLGKPHNS